MAKAPQFVVPELTDEALALADAPDAGDLEHLMNAGPEWRWSIYRRLTSAEKANYPGQHRVWLASAEGRMDIPAFQAEWGGGTFDFFGTIEGEQGLKKRRTISLRGALKPLAPVEVPQTMHTPSQLQPSGPTTTELAILKTLEAISTRLATPPPAAPGLTIKDLIEWQKVMVGNQPEAPDGSKVVEAMIGMLERGIGIGTEHSGERSTAEVIVDKVLPSVEKLASAIMTARRRPMVPNPRAPEAEVVGGQPTPAPPAPPTETETEDYAEAATWTTVVLSLVRALQSQLGPDPVEPEDFAATLEHVLPDEDLEALARLTPQDAIRQLAAMAPPHREILSTPQALDFVTKVLVELGSESATT